MTKGQEDTFRERVPGRKVVAKVFRSSRKKDPQSQSRRRPLPEYRLSGSSGYLPASPVKHIHLGPRSTYLNTETSSPWSEFTEECDPPADGNTR